MKKEKLEYKSICPICFRPCLSNEDLDDLAGEVCHRWCKQRVRSADDFQIEWTFARDNWLEQHDKIRRRILQGKIFGIAIFKESDMSLPKLTRFVSIFCVLPPTLVACGAIIDVPFYYSLRIQIDFHDLLRPSASTEKFTSIQTRIYSCGPGSLM